MTYGTGRISEMCLEGPRERGVRLVTGDRRCLADSHTTVAQQVGGKAQAPPCEIPERRLADNLRESVRKVRPGHGRNLRKRTQFPFMRGILMHGRQCTPKSCVAEAPEPSAMSGTLRHPLAQAPYHQQIDQARDHERSAWRRLARFQ